MNILYKICLPLATVFALSATSLHAASLFTDGFESGDTSTSQNGISYQGNIGVTTRQPKTGSYSMEFLFQGGGPGADAYSEQRMSLPQMTDMWIKYDLYVPSNYYHRNDGASNNKFLAVYRNPYTSPGFQVNWSTQPNGNGDSSVHLHRYRNGGEQGILSPGQGQNFITAADRGKWVEIVARVKVPSSSSSNDGIMQMWKNGQQVVDETNLDNYGGNNQNYIDELYLMGWSNSGFSADTYFHIDNLEISNAPLLGPAPPNPPTVH